MLASPIQIQFYAVNFHCTLSISFVQFCTVSIAGSFLWIHKVLLIEGKFPIESYQNITYAHL